MTNIEILQSVLDNPYMTRRLRQREIDAIGVAIKSLEQTDRLTEILNDHEPHDMICVGDIKERLHGEDI